MKNSLLFGYVQRVLLAEQLLLQKYSKYRAFAKNCWGISNYFWT